MTTLLHQFQISPPPGVVSDLCLPLLFFDMLWYDQPVDLVAHFFECNFSKDEFLHHVVPALKQSLSLALSHFLPFAGNIVHPIKPGAKPVLRFVPGRDYVSLTVCESSADNFKHLTGDHPRNCSDFYDFVPESLSPIHSPDSIEVPAYALKITLFPGRGICFGTAACHAFADGNTLISFFRAWGFIHSKRLSKAEHVKPLLQEANLVPFYDRTAFVDINDLDSTYWGLISARPDSLPILPTKSPGEKVRSTFVLKRDQIQKLKNFVREKLGGDVTHLSSFSVACALVWYCLAKSAAAGCEEVADEEPDYFSYPADCRERVDMNPPLPRNYLGCCCANFSISLKHRELKAGNGFAKAAAFISAAIGNTVYSEEGILHAAEAWLPELWNEAGKRLFFVVGSPRFEYYGTDFGWGRATKVEALSIDGSPSISLWKSRWVEGGLEIGLAKPRAEMETFMHVFQQFFKKLRCISESSRL